MAMYMVDNTGASPRKMFYVYASGGMQSNIEMAVKQLAIASISADFMVEKCSVTYPIVIETRYAIHTLLSDSCKEKASFRVENIECKSDLDLQFPGPKMYRLWENASTKDVRHIAGIDAKENVLNINNGNKYIIEPKILVADDIRKIFELDEVMESKRLEGSLKVLEERLYPILSKEMPMEILCYPLMKVLHTSMLHLDLVDAIHNVSRYRSDVSQISHGFTSVLATIMAETANHYRLFIKEYL